MFSSIRQGLFAALAGFTVLICLCYTGLALVISYVTEDMLVDRLLEREAVAVATHFGQHGELPAPRDELIRIHRDAASLPPEVRARVADGSERAEISTDTGPHYHLRALDLPGVRRVYLLADVRPLLVVSKLFQEVGGFLASVALGLVALALLLAYWLSRRLVAPLQVLAREVRNLAPRSAVAFSAAQRRDEIGYLARKLGATLADLHASLDREHAFTRDVSHELRTPLTVMNNTLSQAASRPLTAQELRQLQAGVAEMGNTVNLLFALARAGHIASETFDLRGCIEESLLRLLDGDSDEDRLALRLPDRLEVVGNRHLSMLLINNCVSNALFHGGAGSRLLLSFADGVLGMENTVDPSRPATTQGFQHGQHLLRRIAEAMDWRISFHAGGATYRVEITPIRPPISP
ncbi:signal transduction histidine kinase [Duganella sp. SG902]|uniref:sensor histidine kinase n=1 Tax=Duganella sp. SG902 TaxID=2587016 RepID=UPI00159E5EAC|nr:HAMP domain-containing sensor histidine kinase [Duganella sp. SG902]NVM76224.1 signal transduction histidine kinase [Duganella sp. SG902]